MTSISTEKLTTLVEELDRDLDQMVTTTNAALYMAHAGQMYLRITNLIGTERRSSYDRNALIGDYLNELHHMTRALRDPERTDHDAVLHLAETWLGEFAALLADRLTETQN